jgi:hypothetical protein
VLPELDAAIAETALKAFDHTPRWLRRRWTRTASPADLSTLMNEDHANAA